MSGEFAKFMAEAERLYPDDFAKARAAKRPDCRTCAQFYEIPRSKPCLACKDGDQHQPLPIVQMYRRKT